MLIISRSGSLFFVFHARYGGHFSLMTCATRSAAAMIVRIGGMPADLGRIVASATYRFSGRDGSCL